MANLQHDSMNEGNLVTAVTSSTSLLMESSDFSDSILKAFYSFGMFLSVFHALSKGTSVRITTDPASCHISTYLIQYSPFSLSPPHTHTEE